MEKINYLLCDKDTIEILDKVKEKKLEVVEVKKKLTLTEQRQLRQQQAGFNVKLNDIKKESKGKNIKNLLEKH